MKHRYFEAHSVATFRSDILVIKIPKLKDDIRGNPNNYNELHEHSNKKIKIKIKTASHPLLSHAE